MDALRDLVLVGLQAFTALFFTFGQARCSDETFGRGLPRQGRIPVGTPRRFVRHGVAQQLYELRLVRILQTVVELQKEFV